MTTLRDNILSLFVKFDSTSQILSEKSLDNILLRGIYTIYAQNGGKPISEKQIKAELDPIIGGDINKTKISDSLLRQKSRIIPCGNGRYTLTDQAKKEMEDAGKASEAAHLHVIQKYFNGATTPEEQITAWFKNILSDFFVKHFSEYTQNLRFDKQMVEYQNDIEGIITKSFEFTQIESDAEKAFLRKCFRHFFEDRSDAQNNALFWNYGVTCFAAQMTNANMFADQYTKQAMTDTTFVLDTNVLYTINLEDKIDNYALERLEKALEALNVSLIYLYPTAEEYKRVADASYAFLVGYAHRMRELPKTSQISDAALRYRCHDKESLDNFFTAHINNMPSILSSTLPITYDGSKALIDFMNEKKNLQEVDKKYRALLKQRESTKKEPAIVHDIQILSYVYSQRHKQSKYTILTNDSSLQAYATTYPIRDEGATAISLDALIAILSINNAGVGDGTGFEVLFKHLINLNFMPLDEEDIKDADLYKLNDILNGISEINADKGEEMQREVLRLRAQNAPFDKIQLILTRELKLQERNQNKELEEYKSINADQKKRIEELEPTATNGLAYVKGQVLQERKRKRSLIKVFTYIFIIVMLLYVVYNIYDVYANRSEWTMDKILKSAGSLLGAILGYISKYIKFKDLENRLSIADEDIEKEALKRINRK